MPSNRPTRTPRVGELLLASNPPRRRIWPSQFASLSLHATIFVALIVTHQAAEGRPVVRIADTSLIFIPRLAPPRVDRARDAAPVRSGDGGMGSQILIAADPPPKGFQTISAPTQVPTDIPPIDLKQHFDARNYTGRGAEGGVAYGVVGGTGAVDLDAPGDPEQRVYTGGTTLELFEPIALVSQPTPEYPPILRQAGIPGAVRIQFIVDTLGGIEPGSVRIMESSHPVFEDAARRVILGSRFIPAHLGDRPVRQLGQQRIRFVITQ
jgi:TonB family protein